MLQMDLSAASFSQSFSQVSLHGFGGAASNEGSLQFKKYKNVRTVPSFTTQQINPG